MAILVSKEPVGGCMAISNVFDIEEKIAAYRDVSMSAGFCLIGVAEGVNVTADHEPAP
jgi:hypothetical protein